MDLHQQKMKVEAEIKLLERMGGKLERKIIHIRNSTFSKHPLVFVLLSSFGLVSTFYGFEKVIDTIPYFTERPHMILIMGIFVLTFTGTLYKKLSDVSDDKVKQVR